MIIEYLCVPQHEHLLEITVCDAPNVIDSMLASCTFYQVLSRVIYLWLLKFHIRFLLVRHYTSALFENEVSMFTGYALPS